MPWQPGAMPVGYCYYIPWCCACGEPAWNCRCSHDCGEPKSRLPQELLADGAASSVTVQMVVGGSHPVHPVLETLPAPGAATTDVALSKVDTATTILYQANPVPAGYTVNQSLAAVQPGTRLQLTANGCFARLRWCEHLEC
jgi:hypothetical protein